MAKAENYLHNNVHVIRQVSDTPFANVLRANGVGFVELPLIDHRVYQYCVDGIKKYACIVPLELPDDYEEAIYITTEAPADGWDALISDIESQHKGQPPKIMQSRLKLCIDHAHIVAVDRLSDKYPNPHWGALPDIPESVLYREIKYELAFLGYDAADLQQADCHDVDKGYLQKIIDA